MDLTNIKVNQPIKNYKQLCSLLNVEPKQGNAKKAQLKEFERFFAYHKEGNKYIIDEIYNEPKIKQDGRINNGGVRRVLPHAVRMDRILMYLLSQEDKEGELFLPMSVLLREMNMVNQNYNVGRLHKKKVSKYLNIRDATVEEFFDYSNRTFKSNIESMLNRLENRALIFWSKVKTICVADVHTATNQLGEIKATSKIIIDDYDNEEVVLSANTPKVYKEYRAATDQEVELILQIEGEILDKYNCASKQEIVQKRKWKNFINEVNEILFKKANILYYYDSYKVIRNEERLSRQVEQIEDWIKNEFEFTIEAVGLNNDVQNQHFTNAGNRHIDAITDKNEGLYNEMIKLRSDEIYLDENIELIDSFICMGHKDIRNNIRYTKIK